MGECSACGEQIDVVSSYACHRCPGTYCSDHRLPENHDCQGYATNVTAGDGKIDADVSGGGGWLGVVAVVVGLMIVLAAIGVGGAYVIDAVGDSGVSADPITDAVDDVAEGDESAGNSAADDSNQLSERDAELEIHTAINDRRQEHSLEPLEFRQDLAVDARGHSEDMMTREYFAHETPGGEGIGDRYPGSCRAVGENIAQTYWDTDIQTDSGIERIETESELGEAVAEQWMNSPGHRENILREAWVSQGIGIAVDGDQVYVTQGFCG